MILRGACTPSAVIAPLAGGFTDGFIVTDSVKHTVRLDTVIIAHKRAGAPRSVPAITMPDTTVNIAPILSAIDSAFDRLNMMNVAIIYRDTLVTDCNDSVYVAFNDVEKHFLPAEIRLADREVLIPERTIFIPQAEAWWIKPALVAGAFLIGYGVGK